jgi:hypothetical protein
MIKVLVKKPGGIEKAEIDGTLESLQSIVGGYIEVVPWNGYSLYINEEGLMMDLPRCSFDNMIFAGPVIIGKVNRSGDEIGLQDSECDKIMSIL